MIITRDYIDEMYYTLHSHEIEMDLRDINVNDLVYISYDYYTNIIIDKTFQLDKILFKVSKKRGVNVYPYINDNTIIEELEIWRNVYTAPFFISRINYENNKIYISYHIKSDIYECIITNQEYKFMNGYKNIFIDILIDKKEYMQNIYFTNFVNYLLTPRNLNFENVDLKETSMTLYKYQIQDIKNMMVMEQGVKFDTCFSKKRLVNYDNILFDYMGNVVNEINTHLVNNVIYGGFLINEMGLGKTIECLELICQTAETNNYINVIDDNKCHYFYKRGFQKAQYCIKNKRSKHFCAQHEKTPFLERLKYKVDKDLVEHDLKLDLNFNLFKSKATLIICPTQLCDQWVREYYNKFNNDKIIYMITTYEVYQNITLAELLYADIIVISYSLIYNINLKNIFSYKHCILDEWNNYYPDYFSYTSPYYQDFLQNIVFDKSNKLYLPDMKGVSLLNISWNRIILDEFHEINKPCMLSEIYKLKGLKKWIVTGTPFPKNLQNLHLYLRFFDCYIDNIDDFYNLENFSRLFIRNTKESTRDEIKQIEMINNTHLLNFNLYEKNIYQSYIEQLNTNLTNYKKEQVMTILLKLCCCGELLTNELKLKIKNCKTFEDIQNVILDNNKRQLDEIHAILASLDSRLKEFNVTEEDEEIKMVMASMKREITNKTKEKESIERSYNYLTSVIEAFKKKEEWSCPVCLTESVDIESIGITCCGHKFCWECLSLSLKDKNFCPQCKSYLENNEYFEIKTEENEIATENDELTALINKTKSTKIGNIVWKIKSLDENDKCIVFSQWDDLLEKVGDILKQNNIKIVYCKGTIYQRNLCIKKFKKDSDVKVIMLSSDNAASGLNLTEANKIIFIEPVYGTETNRKNIENQAVGRVNRIGQNKSIEIIRFIMKDTVEEELVNV